MTYTCKHCGKLFESEIEYLEHENSHPCVDCAHLNYNYYCEPTCIYFDNFECYGTIQNHQKYHKRSEEK